MFTKLIQETQNFAQQLQLCVSMIEFYKKFVEAKGLEKEFEQFLAEKLKSR